MNKIISFKSIEEFENLRSINQVQFCTIQNLQKQNAELHEKLRHLEDLLCKIIDERKKESND